ncbi:MAG: trehalose-binding protein [Deltaproteobacteria bacterium]|nr:trehalose-binding protein [Deltaproteobacteria bacterium]
MTADAYNSIASNTPSAEPSAVAEGGIGPYSREEFLAQIRWFHGYEAPGLIIGGFMVDMALKRMPKGILYNAISETENCLPDAVQLLTPCTVGNGWLQIINLGRYAVCLYDKHTGVGVRVFVDTEKVRRWPEIAAWFFKEKPKEVQDTPRLLADILEAGTGILSLSEVSVNAPSFVRRKKGQILACPSCGEAFPTAHGNICRACLGTNPYKSQSLPQLQEAPELSPVPVENALGKRLLHDVTEIEPGVSKGPAFLKGQIIEAGDLCRLQKIGRNQVYVEESAPASDGWVHENEAALAFSKKLAGPGVEHPAEAREGKIAFSAALDGLFTVDDDRLLAFNMNNGVMCAVRRGFSVVKKGDKLGATRAIPLYLAQNDFQDALTALGQAPVLSVLPFKTPDVGILVTGTEVFSGLVKDRFSDVIRAKVEAFGCRVVKSLVVPDERDAIASGVGELLESGAGLLVTTAGLSVDPEDLTRKGLMDAGMADYLYGAAVLPGAMSLVGNIKGVPVAGVPACALYHSRTAFDLLLPRLLAGVEITRTQLARLGHGGFCLECRTCRFPHCPFGG